MHAVLSVFFVRFFLGVGVAGLSAFSLKVFPLFMLGFAMPMFAAFVIAYILLQGVVNSVVVHPLPWMTESVRFISLVVSLGVAAAVFNSIHDRLSRLPGIRHAIALDDIVQRKCREFILHRDP